MRNPLSSGLAESMRWLVVCMALWLPVSPACWAAEAELAELPEAPQAQGGTLVQAPALEITILDGEGALNNIRQRTAREPIVQVQDRNRKPVAGVLVLFAINDGPSGAGASIGGAQTFSVVTGANGRAVARGFKPNTAEGNFTITVTATLGAIVATAIIHQENRLGAGGSGQSAANGSGRSGFHVIPRSPVVKALIAGGVAAGVVVVLAFTLGSSGSNITAGAGSVGHP